MKYLTKEVKIALTAIVAIALLFVGINFLKGINIFKSSNTYYVKFADISGLTVSNPVYANGYPVGIVRTIEYDYRCSTGVVVGIELDEEMRVPKETSAELEPELMGGVKMNLRLGPNPASNLAPGDTLQGGMYQGAMAKLSAMIPAVEGILPKLDSILGNLNRLTADPALVQTLHNTAEITAELKVASARLNKMMEKDVPQITSSLGRTAANAEQLSANLAAVDISGTMEQVNATLSHAGQATEQLDAISTRLNTQLGNRDNNLGLLLNDRALYDNLTHTIQSADSLMIDLKAHPKRYVHFSIFGRKDK